MSLNDLLEKKASKLQGPVLSKVAAESMRKIASVNATNLFEAKINNLNLIKEAQAAYPGLDAKDKIEADKAISYGAGFARGEREAYEKIASSIDVKSYNAGVEYVMSKVAEAYGQPTADELGNYIEEQEAPAVAEEEEAYAAAYEGAIQELIGLYAEQLQVTPEEVMQDEELMAQIDKEAAAAAGQSLTAVQSEDAAEAPVQ